MQYRVWMNGDFAYGVVAENRLTSEPAPRHMLLIYFGCVSHLAALTGIIPILLHNLLGRVWAFLLALLTFVAVRRFCVEKADLRWVFPVTLFGGGLATYMLLVPSIPIVRSLPGMWRLIVKPNRTASVWDIYRGNYPYQAVHDSHSGLQWVLCLASILVFHDLLRRGWSAGRGALAVGLYALTAAVHLYTGVTLAAVTVGVLVFCHLRKTPGRIDWRGGAVLVGGIAAAIGAAALIYRRGGLPMSEWSAIHVSFSTVVLAYPLAVIGLAWGGAKLFEGDRLRDSFVIGWAAACLVLILSGPYYPYPDRGSISAQIPLVVLAASLWFRYRSDVPRKLAILVLLVAAPFFLRHSYSRFSRVFFKETAAPVYMGPEHRKISDALAEEMEPDDVLVARVRDSKWLAPKHAGRNFCAHLFLTADFERKFAEVDAYMEDPAGAPRLAARERHRRRLRREGRAAGALRRAARADGDHALGARPAAARGRPAAVRRLSTRATPSPGPPCNARSSAAGGSVRASARARGRAASARSG